MAKQPQKKSSIAPIAIIIGVLALTVGGFAWLYSTSQPPANTANGNRAANANSTPRTQPTVAANAPQGSSPVYAIGPPNAAVTIEEFADFQCPSCAVAHPVIALAVCVMVPAGELQKRRHPRLVGTSAGAIDEG